MDGHVLNKTSQLQKYVTDDDKTLEDRRTRLTGERKAKQ
jgi:hypothetical protein